MTLLMAGHHARAQVLLPPCSTPQIDDPGESFTRYSPTRAVRISEVIAEGTIESYSAAKGDPNLPRLVVVRIDKVWKGQVTPRVALLVPMFRIGPDFWTPSMEADCPHPVQIGARIRLGANILGKNDDPVIRDSELDASADVLGTHDRGGFINMPLRDPELDHLLAAYQAKTDALEQAATTGDLQARLALAAHMLNNNQRRRALEIMDALRREGVNLAPTGMLKLTAERKDWSDLKRIHSGCYSDDANFDGATFDRADLSECAFRYSSFRQASFRGTDLSGSLFQDSDLAGATYDCATKLPDDLDPAAAGMINVERNCGAK